MLSSLAITDPFGMYEDSDRFTATIIYQIFSPNLFSSRKSEEVTVVLFSDDDLRDLGLTWPVAYGMHAILLEEIRKYKPKSVFVDFGFVDARDDESIDELTAIIEEYAKQESGAPLLFASIDPIAEILPYGVSEELGSKAAVVTAPGPFYTAFGRTYPLWDCTGLAHDDSKGRFRASPALAAFAATQQRAGLLAYSQGGIETLSHNVAIRMSAYRGACSNSGMDRPGEQPEFEPDEAADMEVIWSVRPPRQTNLGGFRCADQPVDSWVGRSILAVKMQLLAATESLNPWVNNTADSESIGMLRQTCAPHLTISVSQLLAATALLEPTICDKKAEPNTCKEEKKTKTCKDEANTNGDKMTCSRAEEITAAIKGHHIIYGGNLAMSSDLVLAPTHTPLPGAYFHAMALDNLLEFECSESNSHCYKRARTMWFGLEAEIVIELLILFAYMALWEYGERKKEKYLNNDKTERTSMEINTHFRLLSSAASFALFFAILIFITKYSNLSILNYTAIFGLLALREVPRWFMK